MIKRNSNKMKAVECTKYGPPEVLKVKEVDIPDPKHNEVLIKVYATTANAADTRIRGAVFPSIFKVLVPLAMGFGGPRKKVLGVELAGEIVETGKDVTRWKVGDRIFASTGAAFGAHAEYACLRENVVMASMPSNMTFEEAAAVPHCALCALHYLRKGKVQKGTKLLIYGASGGIGTFAVQIAKALGAEVTGVCGTANIDLVKSLGADKVIDYTKENFAQSGEHYDVIFDTVGKSPYDDCVKALTYKGTYLSAVHLVFSRIIRGIWTSLTSTKKVIGGVARYSTKNLNYLKSLIESGKMRSTLDRIYTLETMAEAHAYVDKGHKAGNVAIIVEHPNN